MKKYEKYFKKYNKDVINDDGECAHRTRDKICEKFILDISRNKLSTDEIKIIAIEIDKKIINGSPINMWYS